MVPQGMLRQCVPVRLRAVGIVACRGVVAPEEKWERVGALPFLNSPTVVHTVELRCALKSPLAPLWNFAVSGVSPTQH